MADDLNFDKIGDAWDESERARLRAASVASEGRNPAGYAQAGPLAKRNGWPVDVVADSPADFIAEDRRRRLDKLQGDDPDTAGFLADPRRQALVGDDIEGTWKLGAAIRSVLAVSPMLWPFALPSAVRRGVQRAQAGRSASAGTMGALAATAETALDTASQTNPLRPLFGALADATGDESLRDRGDALGLQAGAEAAARVSADAREQSAQLGRVVGELPTGGDWMRNPVAALEQAIARLTNQGAASIPLMGVGLATRNPALGAAAMGVPTGAMTFSDLRSQGVDRPTALAAGAGTAAMEFVGEKLGFEALLSKPWRESLAAAPLTEFAQEFVTQLGQEGVENTAAGKPLEAAPMLSHAFEAGLVGGLTGLTLASGRAAINAPLEYAERRRGEQLGNRLGTIHRSAADTLNLDRLTKAAAAAKLTEADADEAEAFVKHLGADENANVYVPAADFLTLFQDADDGAAAVAEQLTGNAEALAEAGESGDIVIPLAKWVSTVARLPKAADLTNIARMSADGLSRKEIEALDIAQEIEAIEGKPAAIPAEFSALVEEQKQATYAALVATGRYKDAEADTMATVFGKVLGTLAWRASTDKAKAGDVLARMMDRHRLTINSQPVAGDGTTLDQPAYHGTPHTVDRFSLQRIGTGEGAQAYGWGLYFASMLDVAEGYRKNLTAGVNADEYIGALDDYVNVMGDDPAIVRAGRVALAMSADGEVNAQAVADELRARAGGDDAEAEGHAATAAEYANKHPLKQRKGSLYRVEVPEDIDLLDYDKPMSQNPPAVRERAKRVWDAMPEWWQDEVLERTNAEFDDLTGSEFYQVIGKFADEGGMPGEFAHPEGFDRSVDGKEAASHALFVAGIPGLRYADGNSRGKDGERTHNYVIWDESAIGEPQTLNQDAAIVEPAAGAALRARWTTDFDGVWAEYAALTGEFDSEGGRVLNTDLARELSPEYRADRSLSADVHEAASDFIKEVYRRRLAAPTPEGLSNTIVISAGGTGAGKTTGLKLLPAAGTAELIYDTNANGLESTVGKIEAALDAGRKIYFIYTYRDAVEALRNGALPRAARMEAEQGSGRTVPLSEHAATHTGSAATVRLLVDRYAGNPLVEFDFIDNSRGRNNAIQVPLESLPEVDDNGLDEKLRASLEEAHAAGEVSDAIRAGFLARSSRREVQGGRASDAVDSGSGAAGGGQPQSPSDGEALNQDPAAGGVSASGGPQGQIQIAPDRRMAITLFESANRSTFMHEGAHFFLEAMADLAADPDTDQALRDDFAVIQKFLGATGAGFTREQHEAWARSFEQYLRSGKAPSPDMVKPFARFRRWMTDLYKAVADLLRLGGKELSPEITSVMERLVAIDEEIDLMQTRQGHVPLLERGEAAKLGLTDAQWERYVAMIEAATDEARAEVTAKVMQAERAAQSEERKARVAAAVERLTAAWKASPAYEAWKALQDRDNPLFLDADYLKDQYPQGSPELDRLRGMGVYRIEGGVHPDIAAEVLGYSSGDALVKALLNVKDEQAAIPAQAEQEVREAHPELFADPDIQDLAERALHRSKRVAVLEAELAMLARIVGQPVLNMRQMKAAAEAAVQRKTARSLRPNDYLVAERKAARLAMQAAAKGDFAGALAAKRDQAQQSALYSAARSAKDRAESQIKALRKAASDRTIERIGKAGKDYVDALLELLEGHELRAVSGKTIERRAGLRRWVEAMQREEDDTAVSDALLARVESERVVNVGDLTLGELGELHEAVSNLLALARLKNELLSNHDKRTWDAARAELLAALAAGSEPAARRRTPLADMGALAKGAQWYGEIMDLALQPETIIEWLDDGETGPWHDLYWNQLENAQAERERLRRIVSEPLRAIMEKQSREDVKRRRQTVDIPGVGRMTINEIISAALNLGTESNRNKLMLGGFRLNGQQQPFTMEQLGAMLSHLTRADADMIQTVWDATNLLWPEIVKMQESLAGFSPEKIESVPVTLQTKDGPIALRGGYYPLVGDPLQSDVGNRQQEQQAGRLLDGAFTRATTSKGHTEQRTEATYPLLLDFERVLSRHVGDVISDLSHRRALKQLLRILSDGEIKGNIVDRFSPTAYQSLMAGLKNAVNDGHAVADLSGNALLRLANRTMSNTAVMALGFKVSLALANMAGSPVQALSRIKARSIAKAAVRYYTHMPSSIRLIHDLSPMMLARAQSHDVDVSHILATLRGKHGLRARIAEFAMAVHRTIVPLMENMLWLARYDQALTQGRPQDEAIRLADKAIRQTQTKHAPKDLSQFEADPRFRIFNLFAGPLYVLNNRLQDAGLRGKLYGAVDTPMQALGAWFAVVAGGQIVFEIMMGRGPGDDDDDSRLDDWGAWLLAKIGVAPFQAIPFVKSAANMIEMKLSGKRSTARPDPVTSAAETLVKAADANYNAITDVLAGDDIEGDKLLKRNVDAAGVAVGLPTNETMRLGQYLYDVSTGEYTPEDPAEAAKYLIYKRDK